MFTILNVKILYQGKYENRISFKSFQSRSRRGSFQPDDMFPRGIRTPDLRYCVKLNHICLYSFIYGWNNGFVRLCGWASKNKCLKNI